MQGAPCLSKVSPHACSGVWTVATQAVDVAGRNILVTVLDKAGAPIRDLTAAEFAAIVPAARRGAQFLLAPWGQQ